jgi:AsmA protein
MKATRIFGMALLAIIALLALTVGVLYALFDGEKVKAELSRITLEKTQRTLVIAGLPRLSVWPDVGIALDAVTLSEHASDAEFLALESARVSVAVLPLLSRNVQVRALEVNGLKATLIKNKDGTLNIADLMGDKSTRNPAANEKTPASSESGAPLQMDIAAIQISNAQLTWRDEKAGTTTQLSQLSLTSGRVQADSAQKTASLKALVVSGKGQIGSDAFELKLDAPSLMLSPQKSAGDTITVSAALAGAARSVNVFLTLSGVQGTAEAVQIGALAIKLDATAGDVKVKGQLTSPVAVNMVGQTVALRQLAGSLDVAHPSMPMKQLKLPLSGSLNANWGRQTAALALNTKVDASKVVSKVNVSQFAPLALAFDLDVDQLNVDQYLPPKPQVAGTGKGTSSDGKATDAVIDLSALKGPNVNGSIRIGALQVSGLKLSKINAKLALAGGRLDVAPLSMNLYEGAANGNLSLNANGNSMSVRQSLTGVSINPLMKDLLNRDVLEGRGNVALDVSSRGATVGALKKALAGSASLSLKDGAIKGINLAQSLRDIKSKLGQPDTTQQAKAGEKTDFSELAASLKIANGVAHNEDLTMKSPFLRLSGVGDIDIGQSQINYLAKATVVGSSEGQGGKGADQLKGLTVPVRLSGPFENLSYKIEFASMVEDLAKAQVEEKKKEIQTQIEDKAKDLLKGLLGR